MKSTHQIKQMQQFTANDEFVISVTIALTHKWSYRDKTQSLESAITIFQAVHNYIISTGRFL